MWHRGLMLSSTYNLLAITVERYLMIVHPIYYKISHFRTKLYLTSIFVWFFGITYRAVWAVPLSFVDNGKCVLYIASIGEQLGKVYGIVSFCLFLIPTILITYMYARITSLLQGKVHPVKSSKQSVLSRAERNLTQTFVVVTIAFVCCWGPNQFLWLLSNTGLYEYQSRTNARFITIMGVYINSCVNPFIYGLRLAKFREGVKNLFGLHVSTLT